MFVDLAVNVSKFNAFVRTSRRLAVIGLGSVAIMGCEKVKFDMEETPQLSAHQIQCGYNRPAGNSPLSLKIVITSPPRDQYVRSPLTVAGTCEGVGRVNLSGGGLPAPVAIDCVNGQFSQQITFTAGDGLKDLVATQEGHTEEFKFCAYADNTPPVVRINLPAANAVVGAFVPVSGVCENGVPVQLGGNLAVPVQAVCVNGQFTGTVSLDNVDGSRNITATQTDVAGNTATDQRTVVRDMTAPVIAITGPAVGFTTNGPIQLVGTCTTGLPVVIGGQIVAQVSTPCNAGAFSAAIVLAGPDGLKNVQATQTDLAGNSATAMRSFERDTGVPVVTIATPAAGTSAQTGLTVAGACTDGLPVQISGAGVSAASSATCNAGAWTAAITFSAGDGTKNVIARQTDAAGNSSTAQRDFIRDTVAPAVAITAPAANSYVAATFTVSGTCSVGLAVQLGGAGLVAPVPTTCAAGTFSATVTATAGDGNKIVSATQTDAAGNSDSDSRTYIRDTSVPAITIAAPAAGTSAQTGLTVSGACTNGLPIQISGAGVAAPSTATCNAGAWSAAITFSAGDGNKNVIASQTNAAGATGTAQRDFVRDTVAPAVAITAPAANSYVAAAFALSGTCTAGLTVQLGGAGLAAPASTACAAGTFTANVNVTAGDGNKVITATQTDAAGNSDSDSRTFIRDTSVPAITIAAPAANTSAQTGLTVSGACTNGLPIQISGAGVAAPSTATCNAGAWSSAITFSAGDGVKNVVASQTNAAGSTGTAQRDFVRDTAAPVITIAAPAAGTVGDTGLTISGACTDGLPIQISGSGVAAPSTATCNAGAWTSAITFSAGDGTKAVTATQTDAAGNTASAQRNFERDSTAPAVTIAAPAANTSAQTGLTVSGACTNGLPVQISGAGVAAPSTATCNAGAWISAITFSAGEGNKLVQAAQTDAAGNTGTAQRNFVRDNTAPAIAITGPAAGFSTISTIALTGTCTAALPVAITGQIAATVNTTCTAGGTFAATVTLTAPDGAKNVQAAQTDAAGNTGTDSRSFTLDTTVPVVQITSPAANSFVAASFTVGGTCSAGLTVQLAGAGIVAPVPTTCAAGTFSATVTATAGDGNKTVSATQTDAAGNAGSDSRTFVRDTAAPAVTIASPAAGSNITAAFTLTGTCQAGLALNITGDLTAPSTTTCPAGGNYSVNLTATAASGSKNVTAAQTDAAGNTGSASRAFILNNAQSATEVFTADASEGKVDILFIDDNSASMEFEQRALGQRFPSFVAELQGLDWQAGITTTDCSTGPYGICGTLLQMVGTASRILSAAVAGFDQVFRMTIERPETVDCVARGICPSGMEGALRATIAAMNKRLTDNAGFFRDGAALALVILTDEDEDSDAPITATRPQAVIDHFNSIWGTTKKFKSYAVTTLNGDTACLQEQMNQQGGVGAYGTYAIELARLTGGRAVSICAPDYSVTLQLIGEDLRTVTNAVKLSRVPIAASVQVTFTPAMNITWTVKGDSVLFTQPVPAGTRISVNYQY